MVWIREFHELQGKCTNCSKQWSINISFKAKSLWKAAAAHLSVGLQEPQTGNHSDYFHQSAACVSHNVTSHPHRDSAQHPLAAAADQQRCSKLLVCVCTAAGEWEHFLEDFTSLFNKTTKRRDERKTSGLWSWSRRGFPFVCLINKKLSDLAAVI